jgi:hypothetical protein
MNSDQWRRIEQVFEAALEAPAEEWPALLEQACGGDGELRREVESLLAADRGYLNAIEAAISNQLPIWQSRVRSWSAVCRVYKDEMRCCIQPRRRLR